MAIRRQTAPTVATLSTELWTVGEAAPFRRLSTQRTPRTKSRISAFAGTDLDLLLRAQGIDTLVLLGVATSGVVLSTFLVAFDADYEVLVIKDCCADLEEELHQILLEKHFPRFGSVLSASEFQKMLQQEPG